MEVWEIEWKSKQQKGNIENNQSNYFDKQKQLRTAKTTHFHSLIP